MRKRGHFASYGNSTWTNHIKALCGTRGRQFKVKKPETTGSISARLFEVLLFKIPWKSNLKTDNDAKSFLTQSTRFTSLRIPLDLPLIHKRHPVLRFRLSVHFHEIAHAAAPGEKHQHLGLLDFALR